MYVAMTTFLEQPRKFDGYTYIHRRVAEHLYIFNQSIQMAKDVLPSQESDPTLMNTEQLTNWAQKGIICRGQDM
jgi:hypothetical protein